MLAPALDVGNEVEITARDHDNMEASEVAAEPVQPVAQDVGVQVGSAIEFMDKCSQTRKKSMFSILDFVEDDVGLHFYTGLETYSKFQLLMDVLGRPKELKYFRNGHTLLSMENQLFLTLMRLRRNTPYFELGRFFGVDPKMMAPNIFVTWTNLIFVVFGELNWWPDRELVKFFAPEDFKKKFPATRVILDGTECPIQRPSQPIIQQATYSTYKNRNTMKVVVGTSPGGLVTYVSKVFGGATSDRQIIERSNLPAICDNGDAIMADKGFNIDDLFITAGTSINMPTFFRRQNRMTAETVLRDRRISSKRVHVERTIGLGKTFKILTAPLNPTESSMAEQIVTVCYFLCNFRSGIMHSNA